MNPALRQPPGYLRAETVSQMAGLLRDVLGSNAQLHSYRIVRRGPDYLVLAANVVRPNLKIVIKIAGPGAILPCPFERSAAIYRMAHTQTNVPVAPILAADTSYRSWPWRYIVQEQLPGVEWASVYPGLSGQELSHAYSQIGHAVGEMHSIEFAHFGELSDSGNVEGGALYLEALETRARRRIKNPRHADLFVQALHANAALFTGINRACLCHEDLHKHNILFKREAGQWKLSGVLDFDSAWAGFYEADLARMQFWDGMTGTGFWHTYREAHFMAEEYEQRKPLYQLLWCLEYASSTARHIGDTRALCTRLGLANAPSFE